MNRIEKLRYYVLGTIQNEIAKDDRGDLADKIVDSIGDAEGDEDTYLKIVLGILLEEKIEQRRATAMAGKIARFHLKNM